MTREEHKSIIAFIDAALRQDEVPAMDVEADAIIRALFVRNPDAAYRITRLAMAQQCEISALKAELAEAESRLRAPWFARLLNRPEHRPTEQNFPLRAQESRR